MALKFCRMIEVLAITLIVQTVVKRVSFSNNYTYIKGERISKTSDELLTLYQAVARVNLELNRTIGTVKNQTIVLLVLSLKE